MSAAFRSFSPQAFEWISHAILHDSNRAADLKRITAPTLIVASPDADPLPGDPILAQGKCIGYVTSGGYGFRVGKTLALGYIASTAEPVNTPLEIEILGSRCNAMLVDTAFYDPDNIRCRG